MQEWRSLPSLFKNLSNPNQTPIPTMTYSTKYLIAVLVLVLFAACGSESADDATAMHDQPGHEHMSGAEATATATVPDMPPHLR